METIVNRTRLVLKLFIIFNALAISSHSYEIIKDTVHHDGNKEQGDTEDRIGFAPTYKIPPVDASYYENCIQRFKSRNPDSILSTDLIKFRYSYQAFRNKTGKSIPRELESELEEAMIENDFIGMEAAADKILEIDFTDIRIHMIKMYAMEMNKKDPNFHKIMASRLKTSILATGDGNSPETAFHVAQIKEEYEILNSLNLRRMQQFLFDIDSYYFDAMECRNMNGERTVIYFDITEHMQALDDDQ